VRAFFFRPLEERGEGGGGRGEDSRFLRNRPIEERFVTEKG
jgi:hypothetical protein